jgi:hypothetical protein
MKPRALDPRVDLCAHAPEDREEDALDEVEGRREGVVGSRPRSAVDSVRRRTRAAEAPSGGPGRRSPPIRRRSGALPRARSRVERQPKALPIAAPSTRAPIASTARTQARCWRSSPGFGRPARISLHADDLAERVHDLDEVRLRLPSRRRSACRPPGVSSITSSSLRHSTPSVAFGVVLEVKRLRAFGARHRTARAVAAARESSRVPLSTHDVRARAHAARDDPELALAPRAPRPCASRARRSPKCVSSRDVVVVAVHRRRRPRTGGSPASAQRRRAPPPSSARGSRARSPAPTTRPRRSRRSARPLGQIREVASGRFRTSAHVLFARAR